MNASMLRSCHCSRGSASVIAVPAAPGAAGASDPVDVGLRRRRHVVVDHVRNVRDVEAPRGDVGGDEQVRLSRSGTAASPGRAAAAPCRRGAPRAPVAVRIERLRRASSTSSRVRQKTIADAGFSISSTRASAAGLVPAGHDIGDLAHARQLPGGRLLAARSSRATGPSGGAARSRRSATRIVAEKSAVWRVCGRRREDRFEVLREPHVQHSRPPRRARASRRLVELQRSRGGV